MKSQLSGMPNLKLGLNDRVKFDAAFGISQNYDEGAQQQTQHNYD